MSEQNKDRPVADDMELKKLVGQVAAAYFGNSHVTPTEIATVISQIASSIAAVGAPAAEAPAEAPEQSKLTPAQIRRSITRDAIISFEDNKPYKTMSRHLAARGLSPEEYRSKWGLPRDYPMVAPAYSETRSKLAKERGLGGNLRRPSAPAPAAEAPAAPAAPVSEAAPQASGEERGAGRTPRRAAAAQAGANPSVQGAGTSTKRASGTKRQRAATPGRRKGRGGSETAG